MTFLRDASIALWMKAHRINRTDQHQKFSLSVGRELWLKMYFKKSLFLILRDAYVLWKFPLRSSPHVWARRALEKRTEILGLVAKMSERKASTLRQSQNVYFSELVYIYFSSSSSILIDSRFPPTPTWWKRRRLSFDFGKCLFEMILCDCATRKQQLHVWPPPRGKSERQRMASIFFFLFWIVYKSFEWEARRKKKKGWLVHHSRESLESNDWVMKELHENLRNTPSFSWWSVGMK